MNKLLSKYVEKILNTLCGRKSKGDSGSDSLDGDISSCFLLKFCLIYTYIPKLFEIKISLNLLKHMPSLHRKWTCIAVHKILNIQGLPGPIMILQK